MYMSNLYILEKRLAESKKTINIYEQEMKQFIEEKNKMFEDIAYMQEDIQIKHKEEIRALQTKHQEQIALLEESFAESQQKNSNLYAELMAMKNAYQQSISLMGRIQGNIDVFNRITPNNLSTIDLKQVYFLCTINV